MTPEENVLTKEKFNELKELLRDYKTNKRAEIAKRIKEAKEYGDLSENYEYEEAKNQQAFVEGKITELEEVIKSARIIEQSKSNNGHITAGSNILLEDANGKKVNYILVGAFESDPANSKISVESPIGRALLDKKKGQTVSINLPLGKTDYRILEVK